MSISLGSLLSAQYLLFQEVIMLQKHIVLVPLFFLIASIPCMAQPVQVTGLAAFHRSGQTFLTWNEVSTLSGEEYRVYRHTEAITSANVASASRLATLPEGTSIYYTERARALDPDSSPATNGGYTSLTNHIIQPILAGART